MGKSTKKRSLLDSFAANVKAQRAKKKLSQDAVAKKANLSVSYVSMLERGMRSPPLETVEAIAATFEIDARELLA